MTLKNNYKLQIRDWDNVRLMDVLAADSLKELARLYYVYRQSHQGASYRLMLYNGTELLLGKPEHTQWIELYNKVFTIERRKKTINKDFEDV